MKEQYLKPVTAAIRFGIVGLAFLTPLFFLPFTSEFYQFNKQVLIVSFAAMLLILWGIKMGLEGKLRFVRSPLDIPIILFLLAYIIATIFSLDKYVSIFGFYNRYHGGLVSIVSYVIIYFVAVTNLDKNSRYHLLGAFIASATLLAIAGVANFFGYSLLSADWAKARNWTPIGNIGSLNLYLALLLPLTIGLLLSIKSNTWKSLLFICAVVMLLPILLFQLTGPIVALVLGLLVASIFYPRVKVQKETKSFVTTLALITIALVIVTFIPQLRDTFLKPFVTGKQSATVTTDKSLPLESAWKVSYQAFGQKPFFGMGPGTFAYSFTNLKGTELNTDEFWNIRFDLSGNEYLTLLSTVGIIGLLAFAFLLTMALRALFIFSYDSSHVKDNPLIVFLFVSLVVFVTGIFFQDTTSATWLFFALLLALSFSLLKDLDAKNVEEMDVRFVALNSGGLQFTPSNNRGQDSSLGTVFTIIGVILTLGILYYGVPIYQAEISYQKALLATRDNNGTIAHDQMASAIKSNPYRDTYHRSLVVLDKILALNLSKKENKTDADNKLLGQLITEAINQGVIITGYQGKSLNQFSIQPVPGTSTLNVANWEALAGILTAIDLPQDLKAKNAVDAINVSQQAVLLDPKNPVLLEALGNVLLKNNLVDDAIRSYEQAIRVRPEYINAHYGLATALRQKGDSPSRVVLELQATQSLLPTNPKTQDEKDTKARIEKELAEAQATLNQATKSATQKK